jgi:hypothetical protein
VTTTAAIPITRATVRLSSGNSEAGMAALVAAIAPVDAMDGIALSVNGLPPAMAEVASITMHAIFDMIDIVITS